MPSARTRAPTARKDPEFWARKADLIVTDACKPSQKKSARKPPHKRGTVAAALIEASEQQQTSERRSEDVENEAIQQPPPPQASYTIAWSVNWKGKEIWPGTCKSSDFSYQNFNASTVKKIDERAQKKGYRTILRNAIAIISCSGNMKAIESSCTGSDEWEQVRGLAESWLGEKRKGVTIRMQCIYDSKDESSEGSATSEDKRPKSSKNRRNRDETDEDPASNSDSISTLSSHSISSDGEPQQKKKDKHKKTVRGGVLLLSKKRRLGKVAQSPKHMAIMATD